MNLRHGSDYAQAYAAGITFFREHCITPHWERLDNETSKELEWAAKKLNIIIQYLPPHNHRASKAERAIQTWKGHFITILCLTHPDFPMSAWDTLVPQSELTLNLMRGSRVNPALSAWAQLHGTVNFLQTPIAPAGTKVVIFETPKQRASWAPHGVDGFYIGPAMHHYRCYKVFVTKTKHTRIAETLSWHPHLVTMPGQTADETLLAAIQDLQSVIQEYSTLPPTGAAARQPFPLARAQLTDTLQQLQSIFAPPAALTALTSPVAPPPQLSPDNVALPALPPLQPGDCVLIAPSAPVTAPAVAADRGCLPNIAAAHRRTGTRVRQRPNRFVNSATTIDQHRLFTAISMDSEGARLRYESVSERRFRECPVEARSQQGV